MQVTRISPLALCGVRGGRKHEDEAQVKSDNAIAIALPPTGAVDDGCAFWWRIIGGQVVEAGSRIDWLNPSRGGAAPSRAVHLIAIAPTSAIGLHRLDLPALGPKQATAVARRTIAADGLFVADALHVVMASDGNFVSVTNGAMQEWRDWAAAHGLAFDSIVPAPLLIEGGENEARRAAIGPESLVRTSRNAFVAEPALVAALIGETTIIDVPQETIERAIVAACDEPPAELLTGQWARRTGPLFDTSRLALMAKLAAAILLVSLAIPLVQWVKLYRDTLALNQQSLSAASRILSPTPAIEQVNSALDTKLAALGGGGALLSTPLAALTNAIESAPTVAIDALAWHGDGVLSVTLAAPRNEDINVVLIALQSAGYRVTAPPRAGSDGRALTDMTMRSAP
jgi:general secretion pathway protein L